MRAFVLAGGLGTRLQPRFGDLPKALAPLGGRPFLARQLEWRARFGIREVVVCAGHGAERLRATIGDGGAFGIAIEWSVESQPLGTGGALKHAGRHVRGPTLVVNGDTLVSCDPWALERARWERAALGAIALFQVPDARARGRVEIDAGGRVTRFVEKDPNFKGPAWVNGGLYAFSSRLWRRLPPPGAPHDPFSTFSLERDVLPVLAAEGALRGFTVSGGEFFDIGTPEEWERAEQRFRS